MKKELAKIIAGMIQFRLQTGQLSVENQEKILEQLNEIEKACTRLKYLIKQI